MPAVTLARLLKDGLNVWAYCEFCHFQKVLKTADLIKELGENYPVPEVGKTKTCPLCKTKGMFTRPDWPEPEMGLRDKKPE